MPSKETQQVLNDLKVKGFDVSSLERQIATVPVLERHADEILGKGILRHDVFTRNSQARADQVRDLENQIQQLKAAAGAGASEDSPLYKAALEVINEQQELMLRAGFSEDELKAITERVLQKTPEPVQSRQPANQPPPEPRQPNKESNEMPDNKTYLDLDTYQKQTVDQVFGNATLSGIIAHKLTRATSMGIDIPADKVKNLGVGLRQAAENNRDIDSYLDEELGITAKQKELDEAARKKEIDDAYARGKSEGIQESGTPRRVVTRTEKHPIYDNISRRSPEPPPQDDGNKEIPRNKWGDPEIFRARGNAGDRIAAAVTHLDKVVQRTEMENSIPSE